ncbi:MAG: hypothetical protein ABR610_07375, partial [Thermoanaerobaculia bacterium]
MMFLAATVAATLFVTNERAGTVSAIDPATKKTIVEVKVGARARGIALSPDGNRLFVAVSHFRGQPSNTPDGAAALDPRSLRIVKRYKAGTDPEGIVMSPDGKRFAVSNEDAGTASIVDVASGRTLAAVVTGTEPEGVAASPDGRWI